MALNSRVLSKAERAEDSSNAFELGVMSNNTNMAQILATFFNGYLLDFLKTYGPFVSSCTFYNLYALRILNLYHAHQPVTEWNADKLHRGGLYSYCLHATGRADHLASARSALKKTKELRLVICILACICLNEHLGVFIQVLMVHLVNHHATQCCLLARIKGIVVLKNF